MRTPNAESPRGAISITPSDTVDLSRHTKGLFIGGAGNIKVDMSDGSTVTLTGIAVGVIHSISVRRVYATGTTATALVGLF